MASLGLLPAELLIAIMDRLDVFDCEAVARTFNHALFAVAQPRLDCAWTKNARQMAMRFPNTVPLAKLAVVPPQPSFPEHLPTLTFADLEGWRSAFWNRETVLPEELFSRYGLDPLKGPYVRNSPPDIRACLKMDGNLAWLTGPLASDKHSNGGNVSAGSEAERLPQGRHNLYTLQCQVKWLGLTLPVGFERLMRDSELRRRLNASTGGHVYMELLVKCPSSVDGGAGGYLLEFFTDKLAAWFVSLYLDRNGGHCVLRTKFKPMHPYHEDPPSTPKPIHSSGRRTSSRYIPTQFNREVSDRTASEKVNKNGAKVQVQDMNSDTQDIDVGSNTRYCGIGTDMQDYDEGNNDATSEQHGDDSMDDHTYNMHDWMNESGLADLFGWEDSNEYRDDTRDVIAKGRLTKAQMDAITASSKQVSLFRVMNDTFILHSLSFEEFLATVYFEGYICARNPSRIPGLKNYVTQVFTPLVGDRSRLDGQK